jgi:hypothetical protein
MRPAECRSGSSWSAARIDVRAIPDPAAYPSLGRRFQLKLMRGASAARASVVEVELPHETHPVPVVAQLADSETN